ncbi:hypothetical protein F442_08725 [Phytophthora nicotianae P10297]|uniref:RxLR effector protein n=3 Tax=Phytophthora nicotianae TaxID=4792 RepID=W2Q879_PHYN3|nr:hypothetical protein PPTG_11127 [Phytophthora nicotianae INRA-310]ETN09076.1 hypothetical protein PPTG_11127 [Phytophthora nicotianae INRA-310]ETP44735.1 hypothetical protein F442_08725 [Phytophthora nicotianae P10297]KUF78391.1 hypothetical protein AM587_10003433 [Phytophthora nicotianae]KUF81631.1 hypothetical protein AM587_10000658 [Phytophthora nicotianae]
MRRTCFLLLVATLVGISSGLSSADNAASVKVIASKSDSRYLDSGNRVGHQNKEGNEERIAAVLAAHVAARNARLRRQQTSEAIVEAVKKDPLTRKEFIAVLAASGVGLAALGGILYAVSSQFKKMISHE